MRMLPHQRVGRFQSKLSRHPKMHVESVPAIQRDNNAFAPSFYSSYESPDQMRGEIDLDWIQNISALESNASNAGTDQPRTQRSHDGFDFGQFGHRFRNAKKN